MSLSISVNSNLVRPGTCLSHRCNALGLFDSILLAIHKVTTPTPKYLAEGIENKAKYLSAIVTAR